MTEPVTLPAWLFVVLLILAVLAAFEKLLLPALRWLVTHPANQVIEEVSTRLRIGIGPFKRTRRQALIHRLLTDPKVQQAAERFAAGNKLPLDKALKSVERYAREIVPRFNAYLYFRVGYWIGRTVARALYRVRIGYIDAQGLGTVDSDAALVFVPLGINYDRVLEDRTLLLSLEGKRSGRIEALHRTFVFVLQNLWLALRSEWHRFGYACVNFGSPVSMREYCRARQIDFHKLAGEARKQAMARLGADLMDAVGRVVPVGPVALMAEGFLRRPATGVFALGLQAGGGK